MHLRNAFNFRSLLKTFLPFYLSMLAIGAHAAEPDSTASTNKPKTALKKLSPEIQLPDDGAGNVRTPEQLVKYVRAAALQVQLRGETAFSDFRQPNSRWWQGDQYLIVNTFLGLVVVNPTNPKLEGKNEHSLRDPSGRAILGLIQRAVSGSTGEGWAHYRWAPRANAQPEWKSTYAVQVQAPSGKLYIIGSGLYDVPANKIFVTDVVNKATELVAALGPDAFPQFREATGPFRFGETYVFVFDATGKYRVYGADPNREGTNVFELKDKAGHLWAADLPERLAGRESLWYDCEWPTPGSNEPQLKHCLLRKAHYQGETFYVGSGWYANSTPATQTKAN